ncbi:hypothetical protein HPB48_018440 [Haemaphysalis longicornis]|uniref:Uncharacterized protein n=1 Tax=Haemaphysalis longicornis TaxID=44386 RepID=A0A9J6G9D3_HAELO|nr:hypothetical protein HPB48_018440 [Haemaphysalis longicornis]
MTHFRYALVRVARHVKTTLLFPSPGKPENIIATTSIIIIITIARVPAKTFSGMLELHGTGPTADNLARSTPTEYENMDRSPNTAAEQLKLSPAAPLPGVPDPPSAPPAVLSGFAVQDSWSAIQDSLYVILHHGPYQRRVLTCGVLSSFGVLLYAMSYSLLGRKVDHWCSPPDYLAALSAAQWKNRSIPVQENASFSKCTMYGPPLMVMITPLPLLDTTCTRVVYLLGVKSFINILPLLTKCDKTGIGLRKL